MSWEKGINIHNISSIACAKKESTQNPSENELG